jgi:nucleotide-binding universal stress UspA family protein
MRILVPLDGSPRAEFAIGTAAQLARHTVPHAEIVLVRVVAFSPMAMTELLPDHGTFINYTLEASGDYLREVALRPSLERLHVLHRACLADVGIAATICAQAQDLQADLIVMSSSGRSGVAALALGSVAQEVARLATIPTVILRVEEAFRTDHDMHQPFTVLAALDGSLRAEAVLPVVVAIARAMHGTVRLHHVLPESDDPQEDQVLRDAAERYLQAVQQRLQRQGVPAEISLSRGDPAQQIVQKAHAERRTCDLVAIATHGRSGIDRLLLGSVAEKVLHEAHCPLLILRPVA